MNLTMRTELRAEEFLNIPSNISVQHIFLGECFGVILHRRLETHSNENDKHLMFLVIIHDDGQWFISDSPRGSDTGWLNDLQEVLNHAIKYCVRHYKGDLKNGWQLKRK